MDPILRQGLSRFSLTIPWVDQSDKGDIDHDDHIDHIDHVDDEDDDYDDDDDDDQQKTKRLATFSLKPTVSCLESLFFVTYRINIGTRILLGEFKQ